MQAGTARNSIVASKTVASVNSQGSSILAFAAAALFRSSSTQSRSSGRSCKFKKMERADLVMLMFDPFRNLSNDYWHAPCRL